MGNRYLVISDLHLADIEDHPDGWKAYKSSRFAFDEDLDQLIKSFSEQSDNGDGLTLILNGDIFDFDLITLSPEDPPWPTTRFERRRVLNSSAEKSAWKLQQMLAHHPRFIEVLADFLAAGHRLVYVMGNHDREFHYPEVQQVFIDALEKSAQDRGKSLLQGRLRFEPWFYYVPGEIYAEHGHQYDLYTSYRYQLWPVVTIKDEQVIALNMGNVSNRYLLTRMGFFNPIGGDFILNLFAYLRHWWKYYALTRRVLFWHWAWGSLLVIAKLLKIKSKLGVKPPEDAQELGRVARRFDLPEQTVRSLGQLQRRPITSRFFRMIRELWLDRVALALLMIGGTVALALVPIPLWIKLMVPLTGFPLLYFIYEYFAEGDTIFTIEKEIPRYARAIAELMPAKIITFGHSHRPRQIPLARDTFFVDTGTWAPILAPKDKTRLCPGMRNYLQATFHQSQVDLKLDSWMGSSNGRPPDSPNP
jgi:UDP-2,3-diacylglucosamine pyrophosphatase LpxH